MPRRQPPSVAPNGRAAGAADVKCFCNEDVPAQRLGAQVVTKRAGRRCKTSHLGRQDGPFCRPERPESRCRKGAAASRQCRCKVISAPAGHRCPWPAGFRHRPCSFSKSRISVSSRSSADGAGGAGGVALAASFLRVSLLMPFTSRNTQRAMMVKSMMVWMNWP